MHITGLIFFPLILSWLKLFKRYVIYLYFALFPPPTANRRKLLRSDLDDGWKKNITRLIEREAIFSFTDFYKVPWAGQKNEIAEFFVPHIERWQHQTTVFG